MLAHAKHDIEVARGAAQRPRLAFAGDAELAAVVDPRRNLDLQLALDGQNPLTPAPLAQAFHDLAGAPATAAGASDAEEALLEGDLARARAGGAGRGLRARGGAAAPALGAGLGAGDPHVGLGTEGRFLEGQLEVVPQVGPAAWSAAPSAGAEPEEVAEDVAEVGENRGVEACASETAGSPEAGMAVGVVALALVGVREDAVGLRRFLELLLRLGIAGVAVGMQLQCELAVGRFDVRGRGGLGDAEDLVIVALGGLCHGRLLRHSALSTQPSVRPRLAH